MIPKVYATWFIAIVALLFARGSVTVAQQTVASTAATHSVRFDRLVLTDTYFCDGVEAGDAFCPDAKSLTCRYSSENAQRTGRWLHSIRCWVNGRGDWSCRPDADDRVSH
jgi:hypothetical protein